MPQKSAEKTHRRATYLKTLGKIAISLVTLLIVLYHSDPHAVLRTMTKIRPMHMAAAVTLFVLSIYISSIRWKTLIPTKLTGIRHFSLYMVGSFYNTILPGAVSGDAVRAYYLYKKGCPPGAATASVFADRYIGFMALFTIATVAFPFALPYLAGTGLKLAFPVIAISFTVSTTLIIRIKPGSKIRVISEFYRHISHYSKSPGIMFRAYLISLPIQICSILITYVLSLGLAIPVSPVHLCAVIPIIATITLIPISISGVGIREALFVMMLAPVGISPAQATALSLATFLATIIGSLPGIALTSGAKENQTITPASAIEKDPSAQPT